MILRLLFESLRRAPRRVILGAVGVAFPVAMLGSTLLFIDSAVTSMTGVALQPVQVEQRALATSLNVNMTRVSRQLAALPGVTHVDRFASADVVVRTSATAAGSTARLFAVDPAYIRHYPWVRVVNGHLGGAMLDQALRDSLPAFVDARSVTIDIPGGGRLPLTLPISGVVDLRSALPTWFAIPSGDVQGDVALVPRAIVVPYAEFQRTLLPALITKLGPQTPVLNPSLTDLPPVSFEAHISVSHYAYPSDPGTALVWSDALRHLLERQPPPGLIVVSDNAAEPLSEASADATNAKILFLLLGIPGVLVAAALGLAAQSALAEAHRREDALLRLRGATERQLLGLAAATAAVAGIVGSGIGLAIAATAVRAVVGPAAWNALSGGSLIIAGAAALAAGAAVTAVRLILLVRANRTSVSASRQLLEYGWRPLWLRAHLDVVAIVLGVTVLGINLLSGGLQQNPIPAAQGATLGLSFYVLLGPIALWIGLTLLAVRGLLLISRRWAAPGRARGLRSWRRAALRWLARRPARTSVALVLGALAVAFGTQVVTFVATYQTAKQADATAAFGADLRLTPGDPIYPLPRLGREVANVSPIRMIPVRAGTDRKTILALDLNTYTRTVNASPSLISGAGLSALAHDPRGVIVASEIATDFAVGPGDNLPLTLFPDDRDKSRNFTLHVVGVYRSIAPSNPPTEMVMSTAGVPSYLLAPPDFYLARTAPGHPPATVAADLLQRPQLRQIFAISTLASQAHANQRSLTTLNLSGLQQIESVGAALIAAVGVALLGAFVALERRRELAVLQAIGADTLQVITGPAIEGLIAVLGSITIGLPIGLCLGVLAVRILGLFFTLPPPLLTLPALPLAAFVLLTVATSAMALGATLLTISHTNQTTTLREP